LTKPDISVAVQYLNQPSQTITLDKCFNICSLIRRWWFTGLFPSEINHPHVVPNSVMFCGTQKEKFW